MASTRLDRHQMTFQMEISRGSITRTLTRIFKIDSANSDFLYMKFKNASEAEIRDLFLRLQEGSSLNPAEKRNAMLGEMRDFVAGLAGEGGQPHAVFGLTKLAPQRNAWDDLAAHVVRLEIEGGPTDVKAENLRK